jgi:hypothetical protein
LRRFWEEVFWALPAALVLWYIPFEASDYYIAGNLLTLEDPGSHEIPYIFGINTMLRWLLALLLVLDMKSSLVVTQMCFFGPTQKWR